MEAGGQGKASQRWHREAQGHNLSATTRRKSAAPPSCLVRSRFCLCRFFLLPTLDIPAD